MYRLRKFIWLLSLNKTIDRQIQKIVCVFVYICIEKWNVLDDDNQHYLSVNLSYSFPRSHSSHSVAYSWKFLNCYTIIHEAQIENRFNKFWLHRVKIRIKSNRNGSKLLHCKLSIALHTHSSMWMQCNVNHYYYSYYCKCTHILNGVRYWWVDKIHTAFTIISWFLYNFFVLFSEIKGKRNNLMNA